MHAHAQLSSQREKVIILMALLAVVIAFLVSRENWMKRCRPACEVNLRCSISISDVPLALASTVSSVKSGNPLTHFAAHQWALGEEISPLNPHFITIISTWHFSAICLRSSENLGRIEFVYGPYILVFLSLCRIWYKYTNMTRLLHIRSLQ